MPADIFTSYRLDTNYLAGLTYARQAGFRAVYHVTDWWTLGASLENPQQYVPSSVVFPGAAGFFSSQFDNGSSATNAVGATSNGAIPNLHPDVIVKTAFDWKLAGRPFHLESAGLIRSFKDFNNLVTPTDTTVATSRFRIAQCEFRSVQTFSTDCQHVLRRRRRPLHRRTRSRRGGEAEWHALAFTFRLRRSVDLSGRCIRGS